MHILITGGFGYVGGRLAQHLCAKGHQVALGSRWAANPPRWLPQARVVVMPWADTVALATACEGMDVIVHSAGMNASDCQANPVAALEFNGLTTARLAAAAIQAGVSRFLYVSTAQVYARPLAGFLSEATLPTNPHPYATTHLAGENALLSACDGQRLDGTIVRLSNALGAPTSESVNCWMLLFCDLCRQAVVDSTLTLRTNALQQRNFIPLSDVCTALELLLGTSTGELGAQVFNVGGDTSMTLLALAHLIQARWGILSNTAPALKQLQPQETTSPLHYDITRLRGTGFVPSGDFSGETDQMLQFCQRSFAS
jgi:UDP-glucose 4-epimerase